MKRIGLPKISSRVILFFIISGVLLVNWLRPSLPRSFGFGAVAAAQSGGWTQQTSGTTNTLWSVHFLGDSVGWAAGELGTLLRTSNGGATWSPVSHCAPPEEDFYSVRFLDQSAGWTGGVNTASRTGDGGTSFNCGALDVNAFHNSHFPISATQSWSVGFYTQPDPPNLSCRFMSRITFNGASFTEANFTSCPGSSLFDVYFTDANNGWAVGEAGEIVRITNATSTPPTIVSQTSGTTQLLWGIYMLDVNTGWAVGDGGTILKTTNGGENWSPQNSGTTTDLRDVHFTDANLGWAVGADGLILATTNGGMSWSQESSGVTETLNSIFFPSAAVGYVVGENGVILKRTTVVCPAIAVNPSTATLPAGTVGQLYSQEFTAMGGMAPYGFAISAGAPPSGLDLSSEGTLSGTPTGAGTFNFTVRATDANGCTGTRAYSLIINPACPMITVNPSTLENGIVGTAYSQTLTAAGGTAPHSFAVTGGGLPAGLALASTGEITGIPTTANSFTFTVTAKDANNCTGSRSYTVTISSPPIAGLQFYPLSRPIRLLDTRATPSPNACNKPGAQIPGMTARTQPARGVCDGLTIPANAAAITGNITTVQSGGGFLTLFPSDVSRPLVANSNYGPNEILNNVFTVGLSANGGAFNIYVTTNTDVVVDVTGYYAPPSPAGLYFHPLPRPVRLLDTRANFTACHAPEMPLQGGTEATQQAAGNCDGLQIPANAKAIIGNATTVNPQGAGYQFFTLFPADATRPIVASSNYQAGQIMNGPFTVGLSSAGAFKIYPTTQTELVIDVSGYYSPDATDVNGAGLLFYPLPRPVRLLETRPNFTGCHATSAQLQAESTRTQPARGDCGGLTIPASAAGIIGNATVVGPLAGGWLTFWPSDATKPTVAQSNYMAGQVFNRHFIVGLGSADGAFNIFTKATTHLVIDLSGYFAP